VLSDQTKVAHVIADGIIYTNLASAPNWTDYRVSATVKAPTTGYAQVAARYQDKKHMYVCGIENGNTLFLGNMKGGGSALNTGAYAYSASSWYNLTLIVKGESVSCAVAEQGNPSKTLTLTTTASYFARGPAGLVGSAGAEFDNLYVVTV
jgi:hypothetical protein